LELVLAAGGEQVGVIVVIGVVSTLKEGRDDTGTDVGVGVAIAGARV
jgi:hypothetical protein